MKGTEKVANWTDAEILSIAFADNDRRWKYTSRLDRCKYLYTWMTTYQ
jgi:hypothetical protein